LRPHPRNYREHPEDQLAHIIKSIETNGFYRNVVAARDGTILAGHGVVKAATAMGLGEVPVIHLDLDPDDPRAYKIIAGDNEIGRLSHLDDRGLSELLKDVLSGDEVDGLLGTGYDEMSLAALVMVTRPASEIADFDAASEWVGAGMPDYAAGEELYRLVVKFKSEADREAFVEKYGIRVTTKKNAGAKALSSQTWSAWWPERTTQDTASLEWVESKESKNEEAKEPR
jgi:ParB-like chromosome segregation protein Spo0J